MLKQAARAFILTVFLLGASLVFTDELILTTLIATTIALATALAIIGPGIVQGYTEIDSS